MFKLLRRIIILVIAAGLGTVYYQRTHAVIEIVDQSEKATLVHNKGGIGKIGGLGPVDNRPVYQNDYERRSSNNR